MIISFFWAVRGVLLHIFTHTGGEEAGGVLALMWITADYHHLLPHWLIWGQKSHIMYVSEGGATGKGDKLHTTRFADMCNNVSGLFCSVFLTKIFQADFDGKFVVSLLMEEVDASWLLGHQQWEILWLENHSVWTAEYDIEIQA